MALKYQQKLSDLRAIDAQAGRLVWIGLRPARKQILQTPDQVKCLAGAGLQGDHRCKPNNSKRQVTLIQYEYLSVLQALLPDREIDPSLLRRNLAISGINLNSLKDQRFRIGEVDFEGTGFCHPCSRMEENLGSGGYNAMRGHGGINAKILSDGVIHLGDLLKRQTERN